MIRIPRLAFLGVFILLMCVFFPFVGWPAGLWWLLLIPVVVLAWVLRTQTIVSEAGLDLRTLFGSRHLDWAQVKGVRIPKRGYVRADLTDGTEVKLPAVSYDRLRDLAAASGGRIPDPFGAAEASPAQESPAEPADSTTSETDSSGDGGPGANGAAKSAEDSTGEDTR
ncbi:PH domain-containing protein [Nocardia asiatica]|uniref:PH domain-containing protein n=1 Tax=Nocardia asiatica TaxID=209252 RepID=UPI002458FFD5|nr:PH domain-containing protein [Nocardia asiatica]